MPGFLSTRPCQTEALAISLAAPVAVTVASLLLSLGAATRKHATTTVGDLLHINAETLLHTTILWIFGATLASLSANRKIGRGKALQP